MIKISKIQFTKRGLFLATIILCSLVLIFLIIKQNRDKDTDIGNIPPTNEPAITSLPILKSPSMEGFVFNGFEKFADFEIPDQLPIFSSDSIQLDKSTVDKIGVDFGFEGEPLVFGSENAKVFMFSETSRSLRIESYSGKIEYKTYSFTDEPFTGLPDQTTALNSAQDFLERIKTFPVGDLVPQRVEPLLISDEFVPNSTDYNAVSVSFTKNAAGYPILSLSSEGLIDVVLNSKYEVAHVRLQHDSTYNEKETIKTMKVQELERQASKTAILYQCQDQTLKITDSDILNQKPIELSAIELVYMEKTENYLSFLQPVFMLTGEIVLDNNNKTLCKFIMSAKSLTN